MDRDLAGHETKAGCMKEIWSEINSDKAAQTPFVLQAELVRGGRTKKEVADSGIKKEVHPVGEAERG